MRLLRPTSAMRVQRGPAPTLVITAAAPSRVCADTAQPADPSVRRSALLKAALLAGAASAMPAVAAPQAVVDAVGAAAAATTTAVAAAPVLEQFSNLDSLSRVMLSTLSDCELAVSVYPTFSYDAAGGGGTGAVARRDDGLLDVEFDAASLRIPPVAFSTSRVLGVPLPPPLRIDIQPERLVGTLDPATGEVELHFLARFLFTAGPVYSAPALQVETTLTTEGAEGVLRHGAGHRLAADGRARLVGVARVPPTGDKLMDTFLMLPTDALAVLSAELQFS